VTSARYRFAGDNARLYTELCAEKWIVAAYMRRNYEGLFEESRNGDLHAACFFSGNACTTLLQEQSGASAPKQQSPARILA
jgi:hypothetical protein